MLIQKLWIRVKPYLFSNHTIWLLKRKAGIPIPEICSKVEIKRITKSHELADLLTAEQDKQLSLYTDLLKKGELCFYGYINQRYVARAWVQLTNVSLSYLKAWKTDLPTDSAYISRLFTIPSERGNNVAQKLIATICNYLFEKDIYTMVLPAKPQSMKVFYKCGFIPIKSINVKWLCFIPIVNVKELSAKQFYD